jgi:hypothetical protein
MPLPAEVVRSLLHDLDSDRFEVRVATETKLRELGDEAEPALREELKMHPSAEMKRRMEGVLEALDPSAPLTGERLRWARAIQVLERIGSAEAQEILEDLAQGLASASRTRAARQSLERLRGRPSTEY